MISLSNRALFFIGWSAIFIAVVLARRGFSLNVILGLFLFYFLTFLVRILRYDT
jgi:hypothetical protein